MVKIDETLCIQCELCVKDCIEGAIKNRKGVITGPKECMECGHCVAICPKGAVSLEGYDMSQVREIPADFQMNPEDVLLAIQARRSIRSFKNQKLTESEKNMLFEAVRYTATAKNLQDNKVIFVQEKRDEFEQEVYGFLEETLSDCVVKDLEPAWAALYLFMMRHRRNSDDDFLMRKAPAILFIVNSKPWDAGLAAQNVENVACAMGMGVLYDGYLARLADGTPSLRKWLCLEEGEHIVAAMLIGYPNRKYQRTAPRKELNLVEL